MKTVNVLALTAAAALAACDSSEDTSSAPAAVTCSEYCTAVAASCTGADAQYGAATAAGPGLNIGCDSYCNDVAFAPGTRGDTSGNTLACRFQHATLAAANPAVHCPHAGPVGSSPADSAVCGTPCDAYCELAMERCTAANPAYTGAALFADAAACQAACAGFAEGPNNSRTGNTVQCRLWHLAQAIALPNTHCPHASVASTGTTCQ